MTARPWSGVAEVVSDVARLYMQGTQHAEIGEVLNLTKAQVHKLLSELFAEGMPKLGRSLSSDAVRAIHGAYVRGDGSLDDLAEAVEQGARRPARHRAHAEQRVITALLVARVDELRKPRALSLERLACAADVSRSTLDHLRGELADPQLLTVLKLCRALGVSAGDLLDDLPLPVQARPRHARTSEGADTCITPSATA